MAAVKRTAQNTKTLVRNRSKLEGKMHDLASEIVSINSQIDAWEKPIVDKWGYNSAQLIEMNGEIPEQVETPSNDCELQDSTIDIVVTEEPQID